MPPDEFYMYDCYTDDEDREHDEWLRRQKLGQNHHAFESMEPAVNAICRSLRDEPNSWSLVDGDRLTKRGTKVMYWAPSYTSSVTEVWKKVGANERVFSDEQGQRIHEAMSEWKSVRLTDTQMAVIATVTPKNEEDTVWWKVKCVLVFLRLLVFRR